MIAAGLTMVEANIDERLKQMDRFRDLVRECLPETTGAAGEAPLAGEWRQFATGWDAVQRSSRASGTSRGA